MMLISLDNDTFFCQRLLDTNENISAIQDFFVSQPTGKGLEMYLKNVAIAEEQASSARTYLIKSKRTREIAAYFSLRAGLFTIGSDDSDDGYFFTIPAVELVNFAVNSAFKQKHPDVTKIDCVKSSSQFRF